ncbi:MAG: HDIG domain-containing metalloprotein [Candidatus Omnitrophota bacterium]
MKNFQWVKTKQTALQSAIKIALGIAVCASTITTIYIGRKTYGEDLKEGDVSLRTIYAPLSFSFKTVIDEEKTAEARKKAASDICEVYDINPNITKMILEKADNFFAVLVSARGKEEAEKQQELEKAGRILGIEISSSDVKNISVQDNPGVVKTKIEKILTESLAQGIFSANTQEILTKREVKEIVLRAPQKNNEQQISVAEVFVLDKVRKEISSSAQQDWPEDRRLRIAAVSLIQKLLEPNIEYNEALTQERKQEAINNTPIVYKEEEVKRDELIIAKGERVTKQHLFKIKEMLHQQMKVNRFMFFLFGAVILTIIFLCIVTIYLRKYEPKLFANIRKLILLAVLFILTLVIAKLITYSPLPSYTIPTAIASILIAMLIGAQPAIVFTFILSVFVGIVTGDNLNVTIVSFVGGVTGVFFIEGARRRSQILFAGCVIGLVNSVCIFAIELLHGLDFSVLLREGVWGIVNGICSAVIITGILPVFEYLFNIVTNISLLELSDLNHPLIKELRLKAPGTYHHSLIVGNLAEAASEAMGANALLARVGAYFHDIGKTEKAKYFSENQVGNAKKKHDKLTPSMSSLIITSHVKDGVELARKYRLNQAVIDFIEQHHGTSLIYYFYQRALEKTQDDEIPKEEGFRYSGPKPQTKETAVVLLADSVEAASRTLSEPTPARIKGLVRKIINNKFIDTQLDQCELTLKDLEAIAASFIHILIGTFHSRPSITENETRKEPETENNNQKQPEENPPES